MRRVFVDLDGVMADFDTHFRNLFDCDPPSKKLPTSIDDDKMWAFIYSHGSFFETMPLFEKTKYFWSFLVLNGLDPIILTAASKQYYPVVAKQKMKWVREHFGEQVLCIPCSGSSSKHLFLQNPGDILIDDYERNIQRWNDAGGVGIHHTGDYQETIENLKKVLSN